MHSASTRQAGFIDALKRYPGSPSGHKIPALDIIFPGLRYVFPAEEGLKVTVISAADDRNKAEKK